MSELSNLVDIAKKVLNNIPDLNKVIQYRKEEEDVFLYIEGNYHERSDQLHIEQEILELIESIDVDIVDQLTITVDNGTDVNFAAVREGGTVLAEK